MGISMLGSIVGNILGGIFNAIFGKLMGWLTGVFNWVVNLLVKYIIAPSISLIVNLINYFLSIIWYNISLFILNLIDYVQVLFRALAGINDGDIKLKLSSGGDDGDLLIQLIQSEDVKNVFLSMCIVGVFLLVITTIFQIIKVEYTTEGAKNAKGPILNKAFKGLCNMIMIPALCICGVFIGNRVLELLDIATKPDENSTIAGQLFVAAAGDAFYEEKDFEVYVSSPEPAFATLQLLVQIFPIVWNSARDAWGDVDSSSGEAGDPQKDGYTIDDKYIVEHTFNKDTVESQFSQNAEGYSYYNIANVTSYYNISKINYLLLIFGGCILIKTLYFTCFGMIVRLYQCGMLFIISPAVIGMTPINEGGLGKWRSDFIGSAISAYGVVLAMNIYLILVKVLLSIEFTFEGKGTYYFGAGVMEGLLKCVIVIGGALYIEKFSGQIGGYFGAKDALAQGKDMEKGVKDQAKKAVSTGVTVAMMATGAGGAAIKGAKGLAGAMKAGGLKGGASFIGGGIKKGALKLTDAVEGQIQTVADGLGFNYKTRTDRNIERSARNAAREAGAAQSDLKRQEMSFNKAEAADDKEKAMYTQRLHDWENKLAAYEASGDTKNAGIARREITSNKNKIDSINVRQNDRIEALAKAEERVKTSKAEASKTQEELQTRRTQRSSEAIVHREANRQAAKSFFNEKTFLGQNVSAVKKQVSGYEDAASKEGGDEVAAALKHLAKVESKAKEDAASARNASWIDQKNKAQEAMVKKLAVEECSIKNSQLDLLKNSGLSNLNSLQSRLDSSKDVAERTSIANQIEGLKSRLADNLGLGVDAIAFNNTTHKFEVNGNYKLDTADLEKMFSRIFNSKKGMNDKQAIEDAVKEAIQGKNAEQAKQIQEIFEKVLQRYTKD